MLKLILSFTGMLGMLAREKVSSDTFNDSNTLFYFGCAKTHAMEDPVEKTKATWFCRKDQEDDIPAAQALLDRVRAILVRADSEGRVVWRDSDANKSRSELLLGFLSSKGVTIPEPSRDNDYKGWRDFAYLGQSYPMTEEYLKEYGVECLWETR